MRLEFEQTCEQPWSNGLAVSRKLNLRKDLNTERARSEQVSEVFSLPITKPFGRPTLPFDWLIHSGLILARCHTIVESDGCNFLFY